MSHATLTTDGAISIVTLNRPGRLNAISGALMIDLHQALRTRSFWALLFGLFAFFAYFLGVISHFVPSMTKSEPSRRASVGGVEQASPSCR